MLDQFLDIKDVDTSFKMGGKYYNAISDVNLHVNSDEFLAVVGESGCGKSTLAKTIMGLHDPAYTKVDGKVDFEGHDLLKMNEKQLNQLRGNKMGMIFQDPLSALNPLKKVRDQISESLLYHTKLNSKQRYARAIKLLGEVGIDNPELIANEFPYQLSGGMRQRALIAVAIACEPDLIIADEPTTALDVTIQAQILDVLRKIRAENHSSVILITHDLGVVADTADRVAIMYAGQIVEIGTVKQIFEHPLHPYTRSLLRSMPELNNGTDDLYVIKGQVPSLKKMPKTGDRFAPRIPWIPASAHEANPVMHDVVDGHFVRCSCYQHFYFPDQAKKVSENNG